MFLVLNNYNLIHHHVIFFNHLLLLLYSVSDDIENLLLIETAQYFTFSPYEQNHHAIFSNPYKVLQLGVNYEHHPIGL